MLNEAFFERMRRLLGDEYADFEAALAEPPVRGVRKNRIKCPVDLSLSDLPFTPLSYVEGGYTLAVPLFINEGDVIRINTESGEYNDRTATK